MADDTMMQLTSKQSSFNHTRTLSSSFSLFPTLIEYLYNLLDEMEIDLNQCIERYMQTQMDLLTLSESIAQLSDMSGTLATQAQKFKDDMAPSYELVAAKREEAEKRGAVHSIHRKCRKTTAEVDKKLTELDKRIQDMTFVHNTMKTGAGAEQVGRLVRRFGSVSELHNNIERSLLHFVAVQGEAARDKSELIALLELEATDFSMESVQSILDSTRLSVESKLSETYGRITAFASTITNYIGSFSNINNPLAPSTAAAKEPETHVNLQLESVLSPPPESDVTVNIVIRNVTLEQVQRLSFQSVVRATGDNSTSLEALSSVFSRNVSQPELAVAVFSTILEQIVPGCRIVSMESSGKQSILLIVRLPDSTNIRILGSAISSGTLLSAMKDRLDLPESVSVVLSNDQPMFLSLEEGSDQLPVAEPVACPNGLCDMNQIGDILRRVVSSAEQTRSELLANKETLMQPCARKLTEAQRELMVAEGVVKELLKTQRNFTAQIEIVNESIDRLNALKLSLQQDVASKEQQADRIFEGFDKRDKTRTEEFMMFIAVAQYMFMPPQPEAEQRREAVSRIRREQGELEANIRFLQSQLDQERSICDANIADHDASIRKLRNSLALLDRMIEVIDTLGATAESRNAVAVMALALDRRIDATQLIQLGSGNFLVDQVTMIIRAIQTATKSMLDEVVASRLALKTQCDSTIGRLLKELNAKIQSSSHHSK
eukprot:c4529_g1_i1.p1 GENE.c4529_g1_i1~~c4529_g1_i1.p1  ORF type:complete len:759 (-),score=226.23 c4529_g1_i1:16-2169(-)